MAWLGPLLQLAIAALGVLVALKVGRSAAKSSDRAVFTARRENAIELATSDDEDKRFIGGLLIEELANSDLATSDELDTMGAISDALAKGEFSSDEDLDDEPDEPNEPNEPNEPTAE